MRIRVWGARGVCPAPGPATIDYGGNTACVEVILSGGQSIILDAGTGIRNLGKLIIKEGSRKDFHVFLTHAHWGHLSGFSTFQPLFTDGYSITVHGGPIDMETLQELTTSTIREPFFPANERKVLARLEFGRAHPMVQKVGDAEVHPVSLNHPGKGFGYKIVENDETFIYMPDNELDGASFTDGESYYEYIQRFKGADLLFHDAQYTPQEFDNRKGRGHSSFITAIDIAMSAAVRQLGLFHHDPDRSDEQLNKLGQVAIDYAERNESRMKVFVVREHMVISI
jgi:phosphoribosyl 1,2-cyclic phosphodiesterase